MFDPTKDSILAVGPAAAAAAAVRLTAPPGLGLPPALAAPTAPVGAVACHWPWFLGSQLGKVRLPPLNHVPAVSDEKVRNFNVRGFSYITSTAFLDLDLAHPLIF